jgi:large subunit ribosomal protein L5
MILHIQEKYKKEVILQMMDKFGYKNEMAVPKIEKVTINTGFGRLISGRTSDEQKKIYEAILKDIISISGQRAILTKAKKAVSAFKIRENQIIGVMVTLRGKRMYDFLERLVYIAFPRSRDFQGIDKKSVDRQGNLTIGIKEHICFPEISPEQVKNIFGLEVTVVTNAKNREEGLELLRLMGFPIKP